MRSQDGRSLLVQFDLRGDGDTADTRVQPVLDAVAARAAGTSEADRRRVRRGKRQPRARRDDRQGLLPGGAPLRAGDLRDPAARVRRLRRRRRAGAARVVGGTRIGRALEPREPRRARVRRDELGDPVDRDGGRGRLLALLRQTRTRGARGGTRRARGAPPGGGDVRTGGADLRRDRARRDGRHAARRVRRLHLARDRRDDRRVRVDARLPHRSPGPAREARRPHRSRRGRRGRRRDRPRAAPRASVGRAPAHAPHAPAADQGQRAAESRVWGAILRPSLRHPATAALLSTAFLVALALPAFGMHTKLLGFNDLPRSLPIVQTYESIQQAFPGSSSPATVVVQAADVDAPRVRTALADLRRDALATGVMKEPIRTAVNPSHTVAKVDIPLAGHGNDGAAVHALHVLRTHVVPATVGRLAGVQAAVTGETAGDVDFNAATHARAPIVFAFVLGLAFLLLLLTFRSIVIPIKAIVLNLLSVGAAYGVLVWIFQQGHLQGLLGFHSNGAVVTWLPLFLFTVLFGLSMDYHVFILSRIKELVDRGLPDRAGGRAGHPHDRRDGDERRVRDGRRVLDLRDALDARHQADGRRSRGRGAARRDDRPGGAAAGDDEAARALELVPAAEPALAAEARAPSPRSRRRRRSRWHGAHDQDAALPAGGGPARRARPRGADRGVGARRLPRDHPARRARAGRVPGRRRRRRAARLRARARAPRDLGTAGALVARAAGVLAARADHPRRRCILAPAGLSARCGCRSASSSASPSGRCSQRRSAS